MSRTEELIHLLGLQKHPEGGYFKEVYRSAESIRKDHLPVRFSSDCAYSTLIYYLLQEKDFSAFHRIQSDEVWHFYEGSPISVYMLQKEGLVKKILGNRPEKGEMFNCVVPAGIWFAARIDSGRGHALAGCTVAPGFNFSDFQMAGRDQLTREYPGQEHIIRELTR